MRVLAWIVGIFLVVQFLMGSTITWVYNGERAKKTFWSGTLKVASYVGDLKQALWKGGE